MTRLVSITVSPNPSALLPQFLEITGFVNSCEETGPLVPRFFIADQGQAPVPIGLDPDFITRFQPGGRQGATGRVTWFLTDNLV
jgi:hypothetical protein